MRYLLTLYTDESLNEAATPDEMTSLMNEYTELTREWQDRGVMLAGEGLDPSSTATTVRVRGGERLITDGPFAEAKEQLGGYYVLDCGSIDEAIALAARIPAARRGCVEVRPVINYEAMGTEPPTWRSDFHGKKYVLTLWGDESVWETWTPEQAQQEMGRWVEYDREATAAGVMLGGEGLEPTPTAKTVRVRDGEQLVSDGPFAETKEVICGYDMLECDSLEEAVQVASAHPVARFGKIEVRAVWP
jgi:hypothetical protein